MRDKRRIITVASNLILVCIIGVLFAFTMLPYSVTVANTNEPYYHGDVTQSKIAVMINVYEGSEHVEKILKILTRYGCSCTFFIGGVWAEKNHNLLRKMATVAEIGNHGYLHLNHAKISHQQNEEELLITHALIKSITGIDCTLFAPPSGAYSNNTLTVCNDNGYKIILWSKDTIDWRDKDYELITKRAITDIQNGDLILMHPTEQTVKALPKILEYYLDNGYIPTTVSEVLNLV